MLRISNVPVLRFGKVCNMFLHCLNHEMFLINYFSLMQTLYFLIEEEISVYDF